MLHGWPGIRTRDLVELASRTVGLGEADLSYGGWTQTDEVIRHPYDDGVWLGEIGTLRSLREDVDAVAHSRGGVRRGVQLPR